jgi:hypothetical protein
VQQLIRAFTQEGAQRVANTCSPANWNIALRYKCN